MIKFNKKDDFSFLFFFAEHVRTSPLILYLTTLTITLFPLSAANFYNYSSDSTLSPSSEFQKTTISSVNFNELNFITNVLNPQFMEKKIQESDHALIIPFSISDIISKQIQKILPGKKFMLIEDYNKYRDIYSKVIENIRTKRKKLLISLDHTTFEFDISKTIKDYLFKIKGSNIAHNMQGIYLPFNILFSEDLPQNVPYIYIGKGTVIINKKKITNKNAFNVTLNQIYHNHFLAESLKHAYDIVSKEVDYKYFIEGMDADDISLGHFFNILKPNSNILEIGCGKGIFLRKILDKNYDKIKQIEVIDISPEMINKARKTLFYYRNKINFKSGDIYSINLNENKFNYIIANFILIHYFHDEHYFYNLLEKLKSSLRENGILFITEFGSKYPMSPEPQEWVKRFRKAGFFNIRAHYLSNKMRIFILTKNTPIPLGLDFGTYDDNADLMESA